MHNIFAIVDNFIQTPVHQSFNTLVEDLNIMATYHMPAVYGTDSLYKIKRPTAILLLGSASHVSENLDWHNELFDWTYAWLKQGVPTLGICFGHQLMAHKLGCTVSPLVAEEDKLKEAREIEITTNTLGLRTGEKFSLAYSHVQAVTQISDQFESFAKSVRGQYEGLVHKELPLWCVQSHPEASEKFLLESAGILSPEERLNVRRNGYKLIDGFIANALSALPGLT